MEVNSGGYLLVCHRVRAKYHSGNAMIKIQFQVFKYIACYALLMFGGLSICVAVITIFVFIIVLVVVVFVCFVPSIIPRHM